MAASVKIVRFTVQVGVSPSGETRLTDGQACLPAGRWQTHMYYVYVLHSSETDFSYKGLTDNLERRIKEHIAGENKFTKRYLPMELIHVEICESRPEARIMEKFFKSGYGREIVKELIEEKSNISNSPKW